MARRPETANLTPRMGASSGFPERIEHWDVAKLRPTENNPRKHPLSTFSINCHGRFRESDFF